MTNYTEEVKSRVLEWIRDNYENKDISERLRDREEWEQELNDDLFDEDSITGNASGSFFRNTWKARDMWLECDETEAQNMIDDFGVDMNEHWCDYEYLDVSMRCYVLGGAISEALDELEGELEDEEEEEEENVFYKGDIMKVIAYTREDWKEEEDEDAIITIDFYEGGEIEENGRALERWLWCYEFDKEDCQITDEEVFNRIKKVAEMNSIKIED